MRLGFMMAMSLFVFWMIISLRFQCTDFDRDGCQSACEARGEIFKSVSPGLIKECHCATDPLKLRRQQEILKQRRRELPRG